VHPLTTFVRSLGNDGAVANARALIDAKAQEDWLVWGLSLRLEQPIPTPAVTSGRATA
jgi:hypothetical protein